jgi:serine/threonine-protein kinase
VSRLPEPGETWNDRYEIRSVLGRGGFGRVYGAWDPLLERDVAIKMLRLSEDFTPTDHQRFRRETNIAASLEHRNIVTVYDGGEHRGLLYLVMRFVAGRDLRFELEEGPLAPARAASIVRQVAGALDYAHAKGLVHRDVKPGNILCQSDSDTVFLADFGISRRVDQNTDDPVTQGLAPATLAYAAPEQMRTDVRIDRRADIYALGCVLFECLTGAKPFDGELAAMINAHLHEAPPRPSDRRPELSRVWDHVVATAMAKDPDDRFQRCSELAAAVAFAVPPDPGPDTMHLPVDATPTEQVQAPGEPVAVPPRSRTRHLELPDDPTEHADRAAAQQSDGDQATARSTSPSLSGRPASASPPSSATTSSSAPPSSSPTPPSASAEPPAAAPPAWPRSDASPSSAPPDQAAPRSADRPDAKDVQGSMEPPPARRRSTASAGDAAPSRHRGDGEGDERTRHRGDGEGMASASRVRRTALAALGLVVAALVVWFAWPLLSPGDPGGAGDGGYAAAGSDVGGGPLDDQQLALLETVGGFEPSDCGSPTRDPLAGEQVGVACTDPDQAPTRVVLRRFGSAAQRDSALAGLAAGAGDGDCSVDRRASHDYTGAAGTGRVVCATDDRTAGLSWSVPGEPVMGSARLDDPSLADDLYAWWATLVERSDA